MEEKWASLYRYDSLDFVVIPPGWDENFPCAHAQMGQPGKVGRFFFNGKFMFCNSFQTRFQNGYYEYHYDHNWNSKGSPSTYNHFSYSCCSLFWFTIHVSKISEVAKWSCYFMQQNGITATFWEPQ